MQTPDSSVVASPPPPPYNRLSYAAPSFTSVDPQADFSRNETDESQNSSTLHVHTTLTTRSDKEPFDFPPSFDPSHSFEYPPDVEAQSLQQPPEPKQPYRKIRRRLLICMVIMVLLIIGVTAGVASTIHSHRPAQSSDSSNSGGNEDNNNGSGTINPGGIIPLIGANSNTHDGLSTTAGSLGTIERVSSATSTSIGALNTENTVPSTSSPAAQVTTSTPAAAQGAIDQATTTTATTTVASTTHLQLNPPLPTTTK